MQSVINVVALHPVQSKIVQQMKLNAKHVGKRDITTTYAGHAKPCMKSKMANMLCS